jgi:L-ascorbate metabolism protein UlaG (beta-lactamase superfamily)
MLGPAGQIADFARFLVRRGSQEQADAEARAALERVALSLPPGLEVEWLGVSGYRMTYEGQTLFIDPYVLRCRLDALVRRKPVIPDPARIDRFIGSPPGVIGVLVGHTHFDHAVDAPALAQRFGCRVYGSQSLASLMRLHGIEERAVVVEPHRVYEVGPFEVSFAPSLHSKLVLGLAVPFGGGLTCEHLGGLTPAAYRCGEVWGIRIEVAGVSLYHQGSANLIDDHVPRGGADFFLAGVSGRGFTRDYWRRILTRLDPRTIVPTHYDDFFRPLDAPQGFTANVHLAHVPDEVHAVSRDFALAALPLLGGGSDT